MFQKTLLYHFIAELVTNLMHWQWIVIIEKRFKEVDPLLAEALFRRNISLVCFTSEFEHRLQELLRHHDKVPVVMLPSNESSLKLVEKSHKIQWVILFPRQYSENISFNEFNQFYINNNIMFVFPAARNTFILKSLEVPSLTLITTNSWNNETGFSNNSSFLERTIQPARPLRVAMEKHFPFFRLPSALQKPTGSDIELLDSLAASLKFTYQIFCSIDGSWGSPNGSNWNGMIGMLMRNEVDVALSGMTVTYGRATAVRFSMPYAFDRITFVTKKPSRKLKTWVIFWPYKVQVWLCIALSILAVSIIMTLLQNAMKPNSRTQIPFEDISLYIFQSLLNQGYYNARETYCRILMSFWWSFCITVVAGYNGSLMSFMAHPGYNQALQTVPQLVDAIKYKQFAVGTIRKSADYTIFRDSKEEDLRVILESMESNPNNMVPHDVDGLRESLIRDYAYIGGELTVKADIWDTRLFLFGLDSFLQYGYAIAFAPDFDHIEIFNRKMLQLRESGVVDKWIEGIIEKSQLRGLFNGSESEIIDGEELTHILRVDDVQGAFALLCIGYAVAGASCVIEVQVKKYKQQKKRSRKRNQVIMYK